VITFAGNDRLFTFQGTRVHITITLSALPCDATIGGTVGKYLRYTINHKDAHNVTWMMLVMSGYTIAGGQALRSESPRFPGKGLHATAGCW